MAGVKRMGGGGEIGRKKIRGSGRRSPHWMGYGYGFLATTRIEDRNLTRSFLLFTYLLPISELDG